MTTVVDIRDLKPYPWLAQQAEMAFRCYHYHRVMEKCQQDVDAHVRANKMVVVHTNKNFFQLHWETDHLHFEVLPPQQEESMPISSVPKFLYDFLINGLNLSTMQNSFKQLTDSNLRAMRREFLTLAPGGQIIIKCGKVGLPVSLVEDQLMFNVNP